MEALLFKSNHRSTTYMKDENRKFKREENLKRAKQARGVSVQDKRKIPENLEFSNDSIHIPKISIHKVQKSVVNSKKPSRLELLREWRSQKIKEKVKSERCKKVPFVVKSVIYKDLNQQKDAKSGKENSQTANNEKKSNQTSQRVLRERNVINSTYTVQKSNVSATKPAQKQSYADWKKAQEPPKKVQPRKDTKNKDIDTKKINKKSPTVDQNIKSRPTTRSMRSNTNKNNQKPANTVDKQKNKKDTSKEDQKLKEDSLPQDKTSSDCENTADHEIANEIKKNNIFSVFSEVNEEEHLTVHNDVVEPLVTEKTEFKMPSELVFHDFKFDQKVILDVMSDFFPPKGSPEEAPLFTTSLSAIEKKSEEFPAVETSDISEDRNNIDHPLEKVETKTPVIAFKKREGLLSQRTPTSTPKRLSMSSKRNSLTPNPMNFLHKNEDPIAVKVETPKSRRSLSKAARALPLQTENNEEESHHVKHFTKLVATEESKFITSIEKWEKIVEDETAPEEHQGNILAAIGQAQLFIRKRFNQFKELIELHKDKSAEKAALASDLDGFWEMIYLQVEDVHKRFEELNKLEENKWVEEVVQQPVMKPVKKVQKPRKTGTSKGVATKNKAAASKRTNFAKFREQMMAKKKAEQQTLDGDFIEIVTPGKTNNQDFKQTSQISTMVPINNDFQLKIEETTENAISKNIIVTDLASSPPRRGVTIEADVLRPSVRRSTRKTPSKYSGMNFSTTDQVGKKPKDVVCNLFESEPCEGEEEEETATKSKEFDFTKYLSKTITQGHPVQRDLLTSFDSPKVEKTILKQGDVPTDDLMVFASPISVPVVTSKDESATNLSLSTDDLLL